MEDVGFEVRAIRPGDGPHVRVDVYGSENPIDLSSTTQSSTP